MAMPSLSRMKRQAPLLLFLLVGTISPDPAQAFSGAKPNEFTVLSYNVNGLPWLVAGDDPGDRSPVIGWLANKYDVVFLQEDFEYHEEIAAQMQGHTSFRGNGMRLDPPLVGAKLLLLPFWLLLPNFSPPYGSGLTTFVPSYVADSSEVTTQAYEDCFGWFSDRVDCWASKGFLRVRVRLPNQMEADLYQTHLDAGYAEESIAARQNQLDELASAVEELSSDRAVIMGGDFNAPYYRPKDRAAILKFRERLGLKDSGAAPQLPWWRERDYMFFRSGPRTKLTVLEAGEALEFVSQSLALSDHPALFVRFRLEGAP